MKKAKVFVGILVLSAILSSCTPTSQLEESYAHTEDHPIVENTTMESSKSIGASTSPEEANTFIHSSSNTTIEGVSDSEWHHADEYTVGVDIPAGDYYLESLNFGEYAVFTISGLNNDGDLLRTHAQNFFTFCFLSVENGQVLKLKNARMILEDYAPPIVKTNGYYPPGVYRAGKDIPAGIYFIERLSNDVYAGAYVKKTYEYFDLPQTDDIMYRSMPSLTFGYLYADEGYYLIVNDARFISQEESPIIQSNDGVYGEGIYLVGKDIEAGKYKLTRTQTDDFGYYFIYTDAKFKSAAATAIAGKGFIFSKTISVEEGQYLDVSNATFVKK